MTPRRTVLRNVTISLFLFLEMLIGPTALAVDRRYRLGLGMTSQLKNELPSLSFKLQRTRSFALGGLLGYSSDSNRGGHAAGLKLYRNLFNEPQLSFYGAMMAAILQEKTATRDQSGFQVDLSLGSEFHFTGLKSLGFSLEFGVSLNKIDDFIIETIGNNFVVSAVHFYL